MILRSVVLVVLLSLAGCGPGLTPTRLDDPDALPDRFGVVAVQVVTNTEELSPLLPNWTDAFAVDLADASRRYRLSARGHGLLNARVFIGALPPGDYRLYNLHAFASTGDATRWINAPAPRSLGTFQVRESGITDLGTIVFQPFYDETQTPRRLRFFLMSRVEDGQDLRRFVAEAFPEVYAQLAHAESMDWEPDLRAEERDLLGARLRTVALSTGAHPLSDGRVALTGLMGQLHWRESSGAWLSHDTGYLNEFAALVEHGGGYLLGGERGLVLRADDLEGPWRRVPGPGTDQAVYWMHAAGDGSLLALARSDDRVTFYSADADGGTWQVLRDFQHRPGFFRQHGGEVQAVLDPSGRVVLFGDGRRVVYDPVSRRFDGATNAREYRSMVQQPDGTVVALAWNAVPRPVRSSTAGANWIGLGPETGVESWPAGLSGLPVGLEDGGLLNVGRQLRRTPDGWLRPIPGAFARLSDADGVVQSWGEKLEPGCERLLPTISTGQRVYASCTDGRLKSSTDLGATWVLERDIGLDEGSLPESLRGQGSEA